MQEKPKVTVIIPNYNGRKFMDQCMDALERQTYTDFVVLIVDNGSTDGSVEYLRRLTADSEEGPQMQNPGSTEVSRIITAEAALDAYDAGRPGSILSETVSDDTSYIKEVHPEASECETIHRRHYSFPIRTILLTENTGFSGAVNVGISAADTDYVVLLNNDTEAQPDYLRALVAAMEGRSLRTDISSRNNSVSSAIIAADNSKEAAASSDISTDIADSADDSSKTAHPIFAVSPKMVQLYHQDLLDDAGDGYNLLGWAFQRGVGQPVTTPKFLRKTEVFSACAGAAIYRRDLLEEIRLDRIRKTDAAVLAYEDLAGSSWPACPYFDPLHFAYLEDLDVCFRARVRGYRIFYEPASVVYHVGSGTSGSKYNHFKVRLAARNNVYLNYKNMPLLMLLLNLPGILIGVIVKQIFFIRRGFGKDYAGGFLEGIRTLGQLRPHRTSFVMSRFMNYCTIELRLITDTASYVQDFFVRQMRKVLK